MDDSQGAKGLVPSWLGCADNKNYKDRYTNQTEFEIPKNNK